LYYCPGVCPGVPALFSETRIQTRLITFFNHLKSTSERNILGLPEFIPTQFFKVNFNSTPNPNLKPNPIRNPTTNPIPIPNHIPI